MLLGRGNVPVLVVPRVQEACSPDAAPLSYSLLDDPLTRREFPGRRFRMSRSNAALQVAHQWRLLQATGRAASDPIVGLIGTERLTPDAEDRRQHLVITWIDLNADGYRALRRRAC